MKKQLFLLIVAGFISMNYAFAQLSTRENAETTEKLGARPVKGDMAATFCMPIVKNQNASLYDGNFLQSGDILTFKKYTSDNTAFRAGLRLFQDDQHSNGDIDANSGSLLSSKKLKSSQREYDLVPGIEKHFSKSNIFDVYTGADLFLGLGRNVSVNNLEYKSGDYNDQTAVVNTTVFGLGGVIGVNIFIAHLPISIGLEYGWNAKWTFGGKTKVKEKTQVGNTSSSTTTYTQDSDPFGNPDAEIYSSLSKSQFNMNTNQNVRFVLNIYFRR